MRGEGTILLELRCLAFLRLKVELDFPIIALFERRFEDLNSFHVHTFGLFPDTLGLFGEKFRHSFFISK